MILFGFVWSLPPERVKGNSEDLLTQKTENKRIKKPTEKELKVGHVINSCLSETVNLFTNRCGGHRDQKI